MPAPEDLTPKTPGEPLGTMTPLASAVTGAAGGTPDANESKTAQAQAPVYVAKHIAGGRWHVIDAQGERVGDFVGDKAAVQVELARLIDGGEPLKLDPERKEDHAAQAQATPATTDVDASTLKQPVLTPDGWLCPEPPVKE
ncbi:MAG: hypothetical protein ACRESJ_19515 [Pseudomonas sp.]|uniref:hypothetical protein n=1 Tax=Pseudomonas sp. TaxID=306 RepID=UPI003D6DE087